MGERKKYDLSNSRLPAFTENFRRIVNAFGGVKRVSDITGISRPTINFWYNGQRTPDAESLITLSEKLHYPSDYLLGLTSDPSRNPSSVDELGLSSNAAEVIRNNSSQFPEQMSVFNNLVGSIFFWRILQNICKIKETSASNTRKGSEYIKWCFDMGREIEHSYRKKTGDNSIAVISGKEYTEYLRYEINKFVEELIDKELKGGANNGKH